MARKGLSDSATCPHGCQMDENLNHMLFNCSHISTVWTGFNIFFTNNATNVGEAIFSPPVNARNIGKKDWVSIFLAIAWNIWLARNKKSFDNVNITQERVIANARDSIILWTHRTTSIKRKDAICNWLEHN